MPETTLAPSSTVVCHCRFAAVAPAHHDQLIQAATDMSMAAELLELAVTWHELDYSREAVIPPPDWLDFVAEHRWDDPDLVVRLFNVAVDVVHSRSRSLSPAAAN